MSSLTSGSEVPALAKMQLIRWPRRRSPPGVAESRRTGESVASLRRRRAAFIGSLSLILLISLTASLANIVHCEFSDGGPKTHVKIGLLLEESNYEQANMFIRTIKMINEQKDETIRRLLHMFATSGRRAETVPKSSGGVRLTRSGTGPKSNTAGELGMRPGHGRDSQDDNAQLASIAPELVAREFGRTRGDKSIKQSPAANYTRGSRPPLPPTVTTRAKRRAPRQPAMFNMKLEPMVEFLVDRQSALEADERVCQLIGAGVRALVGPLDGRSIQHVQSICDNLEIAYFELRPFIGGSGSGAAVNNFGPPLPAALTASSSAVSSPGGARRPPVASTEGGERGVADGEPQGGRREQVRAARHAPPTQKLEEMTLNLYPPSHLLNSAYIDLIHALNWTSFAIVYESSDSMIRLQNIFKEASPAGSWANKWRIRLFRHDAGSSTQPDAGQKGAGREETSISAAAKATATAQPATNSKRHEHHREGASFRDVFWRVKLSGEHNILLDVKTENLYEALKQAQQVGCMTEEFSYLVTSLDLHTIDLEDFKYSRTKITSFSLLQVARLEQSPLRRNSEAPMVASGGPYFDEKYLENLGVHLAHKRADFGEPANSNSSQADPRQQRHGLNYAVEAESNDQARRELLQSSPASLGLLPTVNRDNEQRLFDFFLEHQERNLSSVRLSTSSAILHDSLLLYMLGLHELDPSGRRFALPPSHDLGHEGGESEAPQSCRLESAPWSHGSSLVNYMKQTTFSGLTGRISFDQGGLRTDFKLDVMGMAPNIRLVKIGEWHSRLALEGGGARAAEAQATASEQRQQRPGAPVAAPTGQDSKSYDELSSKYEAELNHYAALLAQGKDFQVPYTKRAAPSGALLVNEIIFERLYREQADKIDTLVVTAKLSQPYFMLKETPNKLEGNDQYEGYAVDLIHELAKLVNFKYKWREVGDKKYGSKEVLPNGTIVWNGMIGEIVRGQADLAIVDLTITAQREEAVDFTLPFMNTGISILFKKPTTKVTTLFSFLSPFSSDVWAYVLAAYCGISAILFLVGHLSPYEWADPHPCRHLNPDSELAVLKNQFSLLNSFWFTIGSLMQQGSDLTPRSMSTRTIAGIWYFFTLIMISSYTANLAAFLTVEKVVYPIENVRDLSNQQEIKYGCVESGSTCLFFHDSQIDTYKKIDETMRLHRTYVRSNDEGQKRVGEGKFAFFMESTTIEYIIERNCNLTQIGGLIDSKGYGLATSKKSRHKRPYRTLLNEGILHLQETGMLHVLKNRWWKEKRGGGTCSDDGKGGGVTELSLANVGGVFVVLLGGLGISFLVAIAEFIWRARRSGSTRDRMCEEMMNDLKFALACKSSTKPITSNGQGCRRRPVMSADEEADADYTWPRGEPAAPNRTADVLANGGPGPYQRLTTGAQQNSHQRQMHTMRRAGQHIEINDEAAHFTGKNCDPILLHAMLTMLAQQKPPRPDVSQPDCGSGMASKRTTSQPYLATSMGAPQDRQLYSGAAKAIDHQGETVLLGSRPIPHSATVDENLNRPRFLSDELGEDDDYEYEDGESIDFIEQFHHRPSQRGHNGKDANRRRLLHSQQTIDTD